MRERLLFDFFCGKGGLSAGFLERGWVTVGFDIDPKFERFYPGHFVCADVLTLEGAGLIAQYGKPDAAVAGVPCQGFSLAAARWHRPARGFELWAAAVQLGGELDCPMVIENVRGAQRFFGRPKVSRMPWYLWGDTPPGLLVPTGLPHKWNAGRYGGKKPEDSAIVPIELSRALAVAFEAQGSR
jgi:hypothetical protein